MARYCEWNLSLVRITTPPVPPCRSPVTRSQWGHKLVCNLNLNFSAQSPRSWRTERRGRSRGQQESHIPMLAEVLEVSFPTLPSSRRPVRTVPRVHLQRKKLSSPIEHVFAIHGEESSTKHNSPPKRLLILWVLASRASAFDVSDATPASVLDDIDGMRYCCVRTSRPARSGGLWQIQPKDMLHLMNYDDINVYSHKVWFTFGDFPGEKTDSTFPYPPMSYLFPRHFLAFFIHYPPFFSNNQFTGNSFFKSYRKRKNLV